MLKKLTNSKHFLVLLLTTSTDQARALLDTVTLSQVDVLLEIFYNLLYLTKDDGLTFTPSRIRIVKRLLVKASIARRQSLLSAHKTVFLRILYLHKSKLLKLLA